MLFMNVVHPSFVCAHFICSNVNGLLSLKKIIFFFWWTHFIAYLWAPGAFEIILLGSIADWLGPWSQPSSDFSHLISQLCHCIWKIFFFFILSNCRQRIKCLGMFNRITIVTVFIHGAIKKKTHGEANKNQVNILYFWKVGPHFWSACAN